LNQIVLAAMEAVREMAGDKKLSLIVDLACTPLRVSGDSTRLQQVIMNLLVNAIKYTPSAGAISIDSRISENAVVIQVKDNGEGIDSSFLQHVFEPFRQGTRTWLTSDSGLGLGLAISRKIVEMHQGRIWAESQGLGLGTTFRVQLPIAATTDSQVECVPADPQPVQQTDAVKILVIEDAEDILFILKVELESRGFSVLTATNGLHGLELARHSCPDLIISDIKMPGLDGYELIKNIRATPELAAVPAIALTGFGMQTDIDKLRAAGFNGCISKPADVEDMVPLIHELTGGVRVKPA
jgi:CheY-like chemotaxis protein